MCQRIGLLFTLPATGRGAAYESLVLRPSVFEESNARAVTIFDLNSGLSSLIRYSCARRKQADFG